MITWNMGRTVRFHPQSPIRDGCNHVSLVLIRFNAILHPPSSIFAFLPRPPPPGLFFTPEYRRIAQMIPNDSKRFQIVPNASVHCCRPHKILSPARGGLHFEGQIAKCVRSCPLSRERERVRVRAIFPSDFVFRFIVRASVLPILVFIPQTVIHIHPPPPPCLLLQRAAHIRKFPQKPANPTSPMGNLAPQPAEPRASLLECVCGSTAFPRDRLNHALVRFRTKTNRISPNPPTEHWETENSVPPGAAQICRSTVPARGFVRRSLGEGGRRCPSGRTPQRQRFAQGCWTVPPPERTAASSLPIRNP